MNIQRNDKKKAHIMMSRHPHNGSEPIEDEKKNTDILPEEEPADEELLTIAEGREVFQEKKRERTL